MVLQNVERAFHKKKEPAQILRILLILLHDPALCFVICVMSYIFVMSAARCSPRPWQQTLTKYPR